MRGDFGLEVVERRLDDDDRAARSVRSRTEHRPQGVGASLSGIGGAKAVADPLRSHPGPPAEGIGKAGQDCPGWGGAFETGPVGEGGDAPQQEGGGGRGNLQRAVFGLDRAAPEVDGRGEDPVRIEVRDPGHRAGDVHQGVERAEFVEVHRLRGHPVDLTLGFENAAKQFGRPRPDSGRKFALVQNREEVPEVAVSPVVRCFDVGLDPAQSAARGLLERQRDRGTQRRHRLRQDLARNADVHQGAEQHVSRNAGGEVEIEDAQGNGGF